MGLTVPIILRAWKGTRKVAIVRANRYIVDHTDFLIAYAWRPASNARDPLEYARKREGKGFIQVSALPHNDF